MRKTIDLRRAACYSLGYMEKTHGRPRLWTALWLCLLLAWPLCGAAEEAAGIRVVFFDCGKADSALVQVGESTLLIDTGTDADGKAILGKLRALGVNQLDALVITHGHKDHIGGADRILETLEVGQVWEGPLSGEGKQAEQFREALEDLGKEAALLRPGDSFPLGEATVTCLGPLSDRAEDENDRSLVLRVAYRDTAFLFTGDAEREALDDLMAAYRQGELSAQVLKVPHHGGAERNSRLFFQAVLPKIAFIPCAQGTEDALPDEAVLAALHDLAVEVYIADEGDVAVWSDGSRVWAEQGIFSSD